jgi:hypothetical protein
MGVGNRLFLIGLAALAFATARYGYRSAQDRAIDPDRWTPEFPRWIPKGLQSIRAYRLAAFAMGALGFLFLALAVLVR